jgi:hypothetical protein
MRENLINIASPSTAIVANASARGLTRALMLSLAMALAGIVPASAQTTGAPAAPRLPGNGLGANFDSRSLLVTSSANEHGSTLWIVDSVQRNVMLCEKAENAKDFTCVKKALP